MPKINILDIKKKLNDNITFLKNGENVLVHVLVGWKRLFMIQMQDTN